MKLTLLRYSTGKESTLGVLLVDGQFECYTLEDTYHDQKIAGQTRIPEGIYQIKLRDQGGMVKSYRDKFPWHEGMIHLQNVPNYEYVYMHIGNKSDDTEGCVLVANTSNNNLIDKGFIGDSTKAYEKLYKKVLASIRANDYTYIEIKNVG